MFSEILERSAPREHFFSFLCTCTCTSAPQQPTAFSFPTEQAAMLRPEKGHVELRAPLTAANRANRVTASLCAEASCRPPADAPALREGADNGREGGATDEDETSISALTQHPRVSSRLVSDIAASNANWAREDADAGSKVEVDDNEVKAFFLEFNLFFPPSAAAPHNRR